MVDPGNQPAHKFPSKEWFADFLEIFGSPGKAFSFIVKKHGIAALLFFVAGSLVMAAIVWLGWAPNMLVSAYKSGPAGKLLERPTHLDIKKLDPLPEWLQPYLSWIEQEGESQLKNLTIAGHKECAFSSKISTEPGKVPDFDWELRTERDTEVTGFGFIQADKMFQPLALSKSAHPETTSAIRFTVANASGGNDVIGVFRFTWKQGNRLAPCEEMLQSLVH